MSLFGSIQLAANTLRANDIALQVVGQNIANANTPGYIREEVVLSPAPTQRLGGLLLGLGVRVDAVVQKIDLFLEERLRGAVSDRVAGETEEQTHLNLEELIGELSDTDLSTAMNDLFSSISDILNQPESVSVRNLAVLQGTTLTQGVNRLANRASDIRNDLNDRIVDMGDDLNRLIEEIRKLNVRIAETEGGSVSQSDAVGLRDQRLVALENLAKLVDIRVVEQNSGAVVVYSGGDFLVFEGVAREVEVVLESTSGMATAEIRIKDTDSPLTPTSGELKALMTSRDDIMGDFLTDLDDFAQTLAFEFNRVYASGQGLNGYDQLTAEYSVDDNDVALDQAGLRMTPVNGSFQLLVHSNKTGLTQTTDIYVDLNGLGDEMTMNDLVTVIDNVGGVSAAVSSTGELSITSDSVDQEFAFAADSSSILAALGMNTFFSGYSATSLGISAALASDPAKFAASQGGIEADTENAMLLADFLDRPLDTKNGASIGVLYDRLTGEATQSSTVARAITAGARVFEDTLRGQKMAVSGVSLDEEAIRMLSYQHSFQASARYISTLNELLDILVNL